MSRCKSGWDKNETICGNSSCKSQKKELASIPGVVVAATRNGWMNENLTSDWVEKVWTNFSFAKRMLVWDSFKCHISDERKE